MKRLFECADRYLQNSDWKDLSLIKFCLFSMGVFIGTFIPKKKSEWARIIALLVFAVTYIPLMAKFFRVVTEKSE